MRCLIRHITRRSKSGVTHEDKTFEGERLTIGRGTDQNVFLADLRVALQHAHITMTDDGRFLVQATSLSGIWVNNQPTQKVSLSIGDFIAIGNHRITLIAPPKDYDLALEIETTRSGTQEESTLLARSRIGLVAAGMHKRRWSWTFFLVVLVLFLILPMSGSLNDAWRDSLRKLPIISDAIWDTGKLAHPHEFLGKNCNACHEQPFVRVRSSACVACHSQTAHHVDPALHKVELFIGVRCANCHREHNAPVSLVRHDEGFCTNCHVDLPQVASATELFNVSDFGDDHPEFRPTLISRSGDVDEITRVGLDANQGLREKSGLRFTHEAHLKEEGIKSPKGRVHLQCANCHIPEPGGALMLPVDMETMCQDCHRLGFDLNDPDRELPHGNVTQVLETLEEYYGMRALKGGYVEDAAPEVVRRRRRPGDRMTNQEIKEALAWASAKWRNVAEEIFEFRTCVGCHEVSRVAVDPPRWEIAPVRIADNWLPKAIFTHDPHRTMECGDCHAAASSEASEDVLIPGIATCRQCHGGAKAATKIGSNCVDCHKFHIHENVLMVGQNLEKEQ
ncbi:MAG: cytochrome c3 family protein [Candidatus Tectomicrobia bacterium]